MKILFPALLIFSFSTVALAAPKYQQAQTSQPSETEGLSENPATPGQREDVDSAKDPKRGEASGAIVRKHDTPVTLDPAKDGKMKKAEKKKKAERHTDPQSSDTPETTD
jgi:hypothetical protein